MGNGLAGLQRRLGGVRQPIKLVGKVLLPSAPFPNYFVELLHYFIPILSFHLKKGHVRLVVA